MPKIDFIRPELKRLLPIYKLINDCVAGEIKVKEGKDTYLPRPNASDTSPANIARYAAYILRAVFYNVTGRTLAGFAGQVFLQDATIEVPTELQIVVDDSTGEGVSLNQLAKRVTRNVFANGRAGVFTDFPNTGGKQTIAQVRSGIVRPVIKEYPAEAIVNWRTYKQGAKELLSLVVIEEPVITSDDGFEIKTSTQWKVLLITGGIYHIQMWDKSSGDFGMISDVTPTDYNNKPLTEIPFSFVGSENNDSEVDAPPMYDIASLNIAHYRNSADYEEMCFIVGQATPVFTGLTEEWVTNVLGGTVQLGSMGSISLPPSSTAFLLQAKSNGITAEAMAAKEKQMVALGAKLVEAKTVQQTATEANINNMSETSLLVSAANNVSLAIEKALQFAALFVGSSQEVKFSLATDFGFAKMTPEEIKQVVSNWQSGATSFGEMRNALTKSGFAELELEEAVRQIEAGKLSSLPYSPQMDTAFQNAVADGLYRVSDYRRWARSVGIIPADVTDAMLDAAIPAPPMTDTEV